MLVTILADGIKQQTLMIFKVETSKRIDQALQKYEMVKQTGSSFFVNLVPGTTKK